MSALGQKQTHAVQQRMSALPPIATTKADICKRSCLLCPQKRTCAVQTQMSAKGHNRTHAPQQKASLFDHLIGAGEQRGRHGEADRVSSLEIDDEIVFRGLLHRQIAWRGPFKYPVYIVGSPTENRRLVRTKRHQMACSRMLPIWGAGG